VPRSQKEPNNSTFPKILAAAAPSFLSDFCNKIGGLLPRQGDTDAATQALGLAGAHLPQRGRLSRLPSDRSFDLMERDA
jgi:hypothetical protein